MVRYLGRPTSRLTEVVPHGEYQTTTWHQNARHFDSCGRLVRGTQQRINTHRPVDARRGKSGVLKRPHSELRRTTQTEFSRTSPSRVQCRRRDIDPYQANPLVSGYPQPWTTSAAPQIGKNAATLHSNLGQESVQFPHRHIAVRAQPRRILIAENLCPRSRRHTRFRLSEDLREPLTPRFRAHLISMPDRGGTNPLVNQWPGPGRWWGLRCRR